MLEKETIKQAAIFAGFAAGIIGLGYAFSHDDQKQELRDNYFYCDGLLKKASDNEANRTFVYDQVTILEGFHAGKTCRQIIEEYRVREHK